MVEGVNYLNDPVVYYPEAARLSGIEGTTFVRVLINADGTVAEASVKKTSGNALLDKEALRAIRKTRFKAYRENGVALPFYTVAPIAFSLAEE
jgi:protein TonB